MNSNKTNLSTDGISNLSDSVSSTEQGALNSMREEVELEPKSSKKTKNSSYKRKIGDSHKELLEKYLKENHLIGPTEARDMLYKETGLEVSIPSIWRTLKKIKENQDGTESSPAGSISKIGNKLKYPHIVCLKKYLVEHNFIGPVEARTRLYNDTGLKVCVSTIKKALAMLREEMFPDQVNLDSSTSKFNVRTRQLNHFTKLKDSHFECLKKYLRENICIGNTEARDRLREETGLEVSVTPIRKALIRLEKEIEQDMEFPSSGSVPKFGSINYSYGYKLKYLHIQCLKKYLSENASISSSKARDMLHQETGLEIGIKTVRCALGNLRKEIDQADKESPFPETATKVRSRIGCYGFKLKDLHMEFLKKCLNEDIFIGPTKARNKLYKETGLEVSVPAVRDALIELKEHINPEQAITSSPASESKVKSSSRSYKLKDEHIECLKKYLNENSYIGSTKARNRLHKETGLEVSVYPVQNALIRLRKESNQESNKSSLSIPESKAKSRNTYFGYKLKDLHIGLLKKYLSEDSSIGPSKVKERLYEDTGLEMSITAIRNAIVKLRGVSEPE